MYKNKEPKELLELINKHEMLTFGSQIQLRDELNRRDLPIPAEDLNKTINDKITKIKNLDFLPDLGFRVEQSENSFRVFRTTKALIIDILAILFGLVFCVAGFIGIVGLLSSLATGTEVGFSSIITAIIYVALGILGIKFLSGVKRFFDFLGFELSKSENNIVLKKRFDLKLEEQKIAVSSLSLEKYKDKRILKIDDDDLLDSNANDIVQKMTIESLYKKLQS